MYRIERHVQHWSWQPIRLFLEVASNPQRGRVWDVREVGLQIHVWRDVNRSEVARMAAARRLIGDDDDVLELNALQ